MPMVFKAGIVALNTDASSHGWGGHWADSWVYGLFTQDEAAQSSTFREVLAVKLFFMHFKPQLLHRLHQPFSGNVTPVGVLQPIVDNFGVHQILSWGSRVDALNNIVKELWDDACQHGFVWKALWVPRDQNVVADRLSKALTFTIVLNPDSFRLFYLNMRVKPTCQAFTNREGVLPVVKGKYWNISEPGAEHIDFFLHVWDSDCLPLLTPPWRIMAKVLAHLRDVKCNALLVCPLWEKASWWPTLQKSEVWRWLPPRDVPMFIVLGTGRPSRNPKKLRFPSGFFMIHGAGV